MKVGDRVLFVAERNATPELGTVAACQGAIWVDVQLDAGPLVEHVFAASTHFQSPRGHYCVLAQQFDMGKYCQSTPVCPGSSSEPPSREDCHTRSIQSVTK